MAMTSHYNVDLGAVNPVIIFFFFFFPVFVGTERQLWTYQIASIQYDFVSRPFVRHFLLNASFNSEEDNYSLSLKREIPVKKTAS